MESNQELEQIFNRLLDAKVKNQADLKDWYRLAHSFEIQCQQLDIELPELVHHYLSDADIRFKDPSYGLEQVSAAHEFLKLYI